MIPFGMQGQSYFEYTDELRSAYNSAINLKLVEAQKKIDLIKIDDSDNMLTYHIEDYIDFFRMFINEDKDEFSRLEPNKDVRIKMLNKGPKDSPYYLFSIAEVHLHWATARLKFDEKLDAAREVYKAYKLLEKNVEKFPDFELNKKSLSIIHSIAESIPSWIRTIAGIEGSIKKGTREIAELIAYSKGSDDMFLAESYGIYAYILFYQNNQKEKAYQVLKESGLSRFSNPLLTFLMANIAQKTGRNEEAITILKSRPKGDEYLPFYYLDFMLGKYKLYRLDKDAEVEMKMFIDQFRGRHFIKEAYQKLAWNALVQEDNLVGYKKYMKLCQDEGYSLIDEDKQALKEAESSAIPNTTLLKARLLFDGGYYAEAYKILIVKAHLFFQDNDELYEYLYRLGRVQHELENYTEALSNYGRVIDHDQDTYMGCNAALQSGIIYESQKNYEKSKEFYEKCLSIDPEKYKESLHQKAKSGLDRLKHY